MATQSANLELHREGPSVWERQLSSAQCWGMAASGLFLIAAGTALMARAFGPQLKLRVQSKFQAAPLDEVTASSEASFPASDPPSWTPTVGSAH